MASTARQEATTTAQGSTASGFVRTAGVLCVAGAAGWLVTGSVTTVTGELDGAAFAVWEGAWILVQSLLLVGVVGLALSGAAPGLFGGIALAIALLGRIDFVAADFHSLISGTESFLLPLGAVITAVGMTLVGVAVLRARRWEGWRRFTPLVVGLYPFAAMFPFIFISDEPNMLAIALWGVPWLLLGCALYAAKSRPR